MSTGASRAIELSVLAPVYNERDGIEAVLRHWVAVLAGLGLRAEIVLADDGSTDGTSAVLARLAAELPLLRVLSHPVNRGYGFALGSALAASRGDMVVTLDSDGQFDLADLPALLEPYRARGLDFVTGYRVKKRDGVVRVLADRGLNLVVRSLFDTRLRDTNCAMKLIRGELARALTLEARGFPTPTEITLKLLAMGAKTDEAPVRHGERAFGQSKLRVLATSADTLRFLLYLRWRLRLYRAGVIQSP